MKSLSNLESKKMSNLQAVSGGTHCPDGGISLSISGGGTVGSGSIAIIIEYSVTVSTLSSLEV